MNKLLRIFLVIVSIFFSSVCVDAERITLSLENPRGQRSIGVGDVFYIKYHIEDLRNSKVSAPEKVPGCKTLYFDKTGNSSSISIVNGVTTQSSAVIYTLTLRAESEGSFSFGPISIGNVKSNTVSYKIGPKGSGSNHINQNNSANTINPSQDPDKPVYIGTGDNELFLKAYVTKSEAYEQEALVYTVKLYSTYAGVRYIGAASAPTFDGFVIEESDEVSKQLDFETYNGKSYATAVIAKYIIFPQLSGELKISGNTYTVAVNAQEYYHTPLFGHMAINKPIQLNVKPNDLKVRVKSLPFPQPSNFSGGVGKFSISSEMPTKDLKTNQAASIVYTVTGTGNIKYVKLPELNNIYPTQIEVYSPTTDVKSRVTGNNVNGSCTFDYSIIPLETGDFVIPSVELVYFNPETKKYEITKANGYNISVSKGEVSAKSQVKDRMVFSDVLMSCDNKIENSKSLLIRSFTYWLSYILPIIILIIVMILYRRRLKELSNIALLKSKKANKEARRRLKKASICMLKKENDKFYDEMLSALWGYISDKLGIPTSDLNRDNVSNAILMSGVEERIVDKFISLLDKCEFAKYASSFATESMNDVYENGCDVINELENSLNKPK